MNSSVADLYERLGMRHSKVYYCFDGATAFLSALLNVYYLYGEADENMAGDLSEVGPVAGKADVDMRGAGPAAGTAGVDIPGGGSGAAAVSALLPDFEYPGGKPADASSGEETQEKVQNEENGLYTLLDTSGRVALYACEATLPFGYVAPSGYDLPEGYKGEPMKLQNEMVRLLGVKGTLLWRCECRQAGEKVTFTASEDGYYYMQLNGSGTKKIAMTGALERKYNDLKINSVLYVGFLEEGRTVTFCNDDDSDETPEFQLTAYRMDEGVLAEALAVLGERHLEEVSHDDTHVSGKLELAEAGRLILSIPYEKGWRVRVNGEEQEPALVGGCLMALDLEPGSYRIELAYEAYGLKQGILLSVVSILTFTGMMWLRRRNRAAEKSSQEDRDMVKQDRGNEEDEDGCHIDELPGRFTQG